MFAEAPPEEVVLRLNLVLAWMSRPFDSERSKLLQSHFDRAIGAVHRDVDRDPKRRDGGEIRRADGALPQSRQSLVRGSQLASQKLAFSPVERQGESEGVVTVP